MIKKGHIIAVILGVITGTIYSWLIDSESMWIYNIHIYLILCVASFFGAFFVDLSTSLHIEKVILLTTFGLITALVVNTFAFNIDLPHSLFNEAFITLFFGGHAALAGAFCAILAKKIKLKTPEQSFRHQHYTRYSTTD